MAVKDGIENEVKFSVGIIGPIEEKLRSLGAKFIESGLETNITFKGNGLKERKELLRLRSYCGRTIITHKSTPGGSHKFKAREETETTVESHGKINEIFGRLGYEKEWIYEKKRQVWMLDGVEVLIDTLPLLGNFVEIEGTDEEIERVVGKLGLDMKNASTTTYKCDYKQWIKERGLPIEDLVFPEEDK